MCTHTSQLDGNHLDTCFDARDQAPRSRLPSPLLQSLQSRAPRHLPTWPLSSPAAQRTHRLLRQVDLGVAGGLRGRRAGSWGAAGGLQARLGPGSAGSSPHHRNPEAQLLRDPGSGRACDPAETPKPAGDAACRSQSRASCVCVIARPANGRGPGCRFLPTGSPAPGESLLALPASEAQSPRPRPPGAGPGECSGDREVGRAPPSLRTGWGGGGSSSVCPTRGEVGRGCASALSCTPGGAPSPDPHPDP